MIIQEQKKNFIVKDIALFIVSVIPYLILRIRQFVFFSWAFLIYLLRSSSKFKEEIVKRMFWGRSSFYKSAFQFSVLFSTLLLAVGGLSGRLDLFVQNVEGATLYPTEKLGDTDYLNETGSIQSIVATSRTRDFDVQTYVVQKGDTIYSIAEKYGVSADTIRWENKLPGDYLKTGQELRILPINGVVHIVAQGDTLDKISTKYSASKQDIFDINWLDSESLKVGQSLLVPYGKQPQPKPIAKPIIATTPKVTPGTVVGSGSFVRPCGCGRVTNPFSNWHGGTDIASTPGCTIVASDKGVVTMARWGGNGGLQIMINHGNGFVTLYAHNAELYVKEGQSVERGQPIGFMGRTGHATGIHLHFGLLYNGVALNPQAYIPI